MELLEHKKGKEAWKLPRNIRQIGEPGTGMKVLIEDYVYTFLHQLAEENLTCIRTAVLVGSVEGAQAVCIRGALEVDMGQEIKGWFTHEQWRDIFQSVQAWFEGQEVVGWYMSNPGFPPSLSEELKRLHSRNFPGNASVFFQADILDGEEALYMHGEKGLASVCGYYIYYERNDCMQAYISQRRGGAGIEREGIARDRAAAKFRNVMQEKREQSSQKKIVAFLYTSCTFLVMVILVIGITLVNNYDRMANMENAIDHISKSLSDTEKLPEASVQEAMLQENLRAQEADKDSGDEEEQAEELPEEGGEDMPSEEEGQTEDGDEMPGDTEDAEALEDVQEVMSQSVKQSEQYEVRQGDTLLDICRERYGDEEMVAKVCEINGMEDGDVIYAGEIILLP